MALRGRKKKEPNFEEIGNLPIEEQTSDTVLPQETQEEAQSADITSLQETQEEAQSLDTVLPQETRNEAENVDITSLQEIEEEVQSLDTTLNQTSQKESQSKDSNFIQEIQKEARIPTNNLTEKQDVQQNLLQTKQRTRIHLVDGEKGGVGKSLVARTMLQYCLDNSLSIIAVEADRSNPDVAGIYSECIEAVFSEDEKRANEADRIFELALSKSVIVNLPAQVYEPMSNWINKNGLIELGKQHSLTFCKWFVCTGGHDSVQLFIKSVTDFGDKMPHVLVRNLGLCDDWTHIEAMAEVNDAINKYAVQVIDFPKFSYRERNMVDEKQITFAQARDSDEFGIVSRQRIHNFLKFAYAQFKNTGLLP
ncbi:MAG: cobalamin biosynthesis protein CobQ [Rhizonema sp. PD37]|nr:cobalamin biosynthesis protein CobQ [Rhizonema sp. PD37]